mgnify:CR=1 FL=1
MLFIAWLYGEQNQVRPMFPPDTSREDLIRASKSFDLAQQLPSVDWDKACLLYTSDAADERSSVDLGGRRIITKKKTHNKQKKNTPSTQNSCLSTNLQIRPP